MVQCKYLHFGILEFPIGIQSKMWTNVNVHSWLFVAIYLIKGSSEAKLPTIRTDEKYEKQRWEESEKRSEEESRKKQLKS